MDWSVDGDQKYLSNFLILNMLIVVFYNYSTLHILKMSKFVLPSFKIGFEVGGWGDRF